MTTLLTYIEKSIFDFNIADAMVLKAIFLISLTLISLLIGIAHYGTLQTNGLIAVFEDIGFFLIIPMNLLIFILLINRNLKRLSLFSNETKAKIDMHNAVSNMSLCLIALMLIGIGIFSSITIHIKEITNNLLSLTDYNFFGLSIWIAIFTIIMFQYLIEKTKANTLKKNHPKINWN